MPRVKVEFRTASKENYKKFCLKFSSINITYEQYKQIIYEYSYVFRDYILHSGEDAKLPWGLGSFRIVKKKPKYSVIDPKTGKEHVNLPIDWKSTKELKKKVYHLNYHTDGYRCKWFWIRKNSRIHKCEIWSFKFSRTTSRALKAQLYKDPIYHQIYQIK